MDETGFLRGYIGAAKVMTLVDGPRYRIELGTRD